jgi:hypothetical protein
MRCSKRLPRTRPSGRRVPQRTYVSPAFLRLCQAFSPVLLEQAKKQKTNRVRLILMNIRDADALAGQVDHETMAFPLPGFAENSRPGEIEPGRKAGALCAELQGSLGGSEQGLPQPAIDAPAFFGWGQRDSLRSDHFVRRKTAKNTIITTAAMTTARGVGLSADPSRLRLDPIS